MPTPEARTRFADWVLQCIKNQGMQRVTYRPTMKGDASFKYTNIKQSTVAQNNDWYLLVWRDMFPLQWNLVQLKRFKGGQWVKINLTWKEREALNKAHKKHMAAEKKAEKERKEREERAYQKAKTDADWL